MGAVMTGAVFNEMGRWSFVVSLLRCWWPEPYPQQVPWPDSAMICVKPRAFHIPSRAILNSCVRSKRTVP